jgi:hypothetical protein
LTLAIDAEVLRLARIRAINDGTSVNSVVRDHLAAYANRLGGDQSLAAQLRQIASRYPARSGPGGRDWRREDIYA